MKNQYFGYVRVSTVKQGEGVSLDAQREAIERYADQQNLSVTRWFEEKETAAKQGRPIFTEMVKLLKADEGQGLIMHKIDRSARNLRDWATVGDLQDAGISVHFAAESVDFASRGGRLTADIQAVIAADYIRNLKDEIRKGQTGRLKQGLYPFSAPFGYLNSGKGVPKAIDPIRGPYVREMYELYATGQHSIPSLVRECERRGYRTKAGCKIYKGKIEEILSNPFYMGLIVLKRHKTPFNGIHKPIISPELFQRVQKIKQDRSRRKSTKHNHLYRGHFKCSECTRSMIPERQRGHVYYRCHTKSCPSNSIREEALDWAILKKLSELRLKPQQLRKLKSNLERQRHAKPANTVAMQVANIDAQMSRLTQGYMEGVIDTETLRTQQADCKFRKLELSKQSQWDEGNTQNADTVSKFLEQLQNVAATYFFANADEKRQMLDLLFSNMAVQAKNVQLSTQSWVMEIRNWEGSPFGADHRVNNRSRQNLGSTAVHDVQDVTSCPKISLFVEVCDAVTNRCGENEHRCERQIFLSADGEKIT